MSVPAAASTASAARFARLRRALRFRRPARLLVLFSPALLVLSVDLTRRAARLPQLPTEELAGYALTFALGALLWSSLLLASARRRGPLRHAARAAFVLLLTLAVGGQLYFFEQYGTYLDAKASIFATNFVESVLGQLVADAGNYASAKLPVLAFAAAALFLAVRLLRPGRRLARVATWAAPPLLLAALTLRSDYGGRQPATPDVLYLRALGGMLATQLGLTEQSGQLRPRLRHSRPLPRLVRAPRPARNVVLVVLESVRRDAVCLRYESDCALTPATNSLFPERVGLEQLRALDSSTAISMAVLWSGVGPHESREVLHTQPLLFDYARATGYATGYFTAQNLLFGNMRLWVHNLGVDRRLSATDVDPASDIDLGVAERLFAVRAAAELAQLREPFLAVVQLSNVHYPYLVEEGGPAPFQPASTSKDAAETAAFRNHYQNAVFQEDAHLAALLEGLRRSPRGARTVVILTSDHGEAFREHGQMGHTLSVYDEELRVPGWVDAPPGTLAADERAALEAAADEPLLHTDLSATVLDLLGVWDSPGIAPYRRRMLGRSLLRPLAPPPAVPLTNCSGVWSCAFENWGYLAGLQKLEARPWDQDFHCFDLAADPEERHDLGPSACGELRERALATFGRLPGKRQ